MDQLKVKKVRGADAKTEYTKQLVNILKPHLYEGIQSKYKDAFDLKNK